MVDLKNLMKKNYISALIGIALLSAGVISLEISLTRVFSAVLRYHFVFLVISIAICGLGLGAMLCSFYKKPEKIPLALAANMSGWSTIIYLLIYFKFILPIAPEALWLIALLVIFPFIFAGVFLAGIFSQMPEKSNVLYAFDLLGAGVASLLIILVLNKFGAINACIISAFVAVLAGIAFKRLRLLSLLSAAVIAILLVCNIKFLWLDVPPMPTKDTSYAKALFTEIGDKNKVEILHTEWDSFARTDVVKDIAMGDDILLVYTNGHVPTRLIRYFPNSGKYAVDANIADVPFELKHPEKVLCIGPGGGLDVLLAKKHNAKIIDGVEINPAIEKIMKMQQFIDFAGKPYEIEGVSLVIADGRTFVKHTQNKYDMIFLSLAKTGTGTFGIALVEGYIYTKEAFEDYLDKLSDDGTFVFVTDGYLMNIRLFTTAIESLMIKQNLSLREALQHVALISVSEKEIGQNPYEYALIVGKKPFKIKEKKQLLSLCMKNKYLPFFIPGKVVAPDFQPLYQRDATLDYFVSCFYDKWKADLVRRRGIKNPDSVPLLNLQPVTDDKPFFLDFSYGIPHMLTPLLVATLVLIIALGSGIYLYEILSEKGNRFSEPCVKSEVGATTPDEERRSCIALPPNDTYPPLIKLHPVLIIFTYFFALGVAFMMIEIPLIQRMILILGHPTYALTVVLFFLLSGAGTGSYVAGLKKISNIKRFNQIICLMVAITSVLLMIYLNMSYDRILALPLSERIAWSGAFSFGIGFFLGMPFPVAMRALGKFKTRYIPWMWCVNGFSSLLGSLFAAVGAKLIGFHLVFLCGAMFYLLAALCSSEKWGKPAVMKEEG
jgi:predicted membrane-bound spermidine synthase